MKVFALLSILTVGILAGCSSEPAASTDNSATTATTGSTTVAEKAKCAGCGAEVPKAELASHDGAMMCKACIAAHNH